MTNNPQWTDDAIFYQIFPDRFANGDKENDPPNCESWDSLPTNSGFKGGDLAGIIANFTYLIDLGVNAIYLNPIFQATSNHRYNTTDYFQIDQKLGTMNEFIQLCDLAHSRGVKVILDGVFNHCGRGFFAFNDVLENQRNSPYRNWFHIEHFPVRAYGSGSASDYQAWWGIKSLPKFNTFNPPTRSYLLSVAQFWIKAGADGWRLDVPNEINDDQFWLEFRQVVRAAKPDAYLVGEIWDSDPRWVDTGHFDGLMNYPLRKILLDQLQGNGLSSHLCQNLSGLFDRYQQENYHAMYNLLGSHDTERIYTLLGQDEQKVKLAYLILFSLPGIPAIYYGDEIGLEGGRDPECRGTFPWDSKIWKNEIRTWIRKLISLRTTTAVMKKGNFEVCTWDDQTNICAFVRRTNLEIALVVINLSSVPCTVMLPVVGLGWLDGSIHHNVLNGQPLTIENGNLKLELFPMNGGWII
jgi:cyclomaltodextrinase / maltogenic alpha-amylase / neopullulanase